MQLLFIQQNIKKKKDKDKERKLHGNIFIIYCAISVSNSYIRSDFI